MSTFRNLLSKTSSVPGFVGGWKSYGRSNSEDASTRDILPDYSGNGRDIKLYNFAFAGMSGFGGYVYDQSNMIVLSTVTSYCKIEGSKIKITDFPYSNNGTICYAQSIYGENGQPLFVNVPAYKIKVSGLFEGQRVDIGRGYNNGVETTWNDRVISSIYDDGIYEIPAWNTVIEPANEEVRAYISDFRPAVYATEDTPANVIIEVLPDYPGGLVSDGVDDYGQCVKDFALPDDYTVVALRKIITGNNGGIASKGGIDGAFLFDGASGGNNVVAWSYGYQNSLNNLPALFSYQTKTSYNGTAISFGTQEDTESDLLKLFTHNNSSCAQAVLYDLRIYDHSLTDEELQLVKDDIMKNYEKNAKPLDGITYVADWDAKGRSNDEDADVRNKWIDKATGKVINLNNFAYAGMSGWNGYEQNFTSRWSIINTPSYQKDLVTVSSEKLIFKGTLIDGYDSCGIQLIYPRISENGERIRLKVTGVKEGQIVGARNESVNPVEQDLLNGKDGIIDVTYYKGSNSGGIYIYLSTNIDTRNPNVDVTIEQLPLYPGALVSDGIDDYGVTQEAINGKVRTMLLHYRRLIEIPTKWGYYYDGIASTRIYAAYTNTSPYFHSNLMEKYNDGNLFVGVTQKTADALLYIMVKNSVTERGQVAIFRFIIIQEQLDGAQVEFLKWKVEKEYREWCKKNGYNYALNQLTE